MYPESPHTSGGQQPSGIEKKIIEILQADGKIHAIKAYKELTGHGLKESKDAVDALEKKYKVYPAGKKGCAGVLALGLVALVIFWWAVMP